MSVSKKSDLKNKVVVITGASSGNGRAAALEFAKEKCRLVLASRNTDVLNEVASECRKIGAEALVVQTDVSDSEQVLNLAQSAHDQYGQIDVWVNNAGVGAVGAFNDAPIEAHSQVVQTNLMGVIYGAYAALPYFKKQKHGVIINTNSIGAWIPLPFSCAYSASKFGMKGFLEALRAELSNEKDIHVCEVYPAFVATPGILHAANFVGKELKNPPLAGDPFKVARQMVALAKNPKDRSAVMAISKIGRVGYFLMPKFTRWATKKFLETYFKQAKDIPISAGNLFQAGKAHFSAKMK